eukprot:GHVU01171752.1.p1 GENE.GHVU01171752.1~~GHVU01171752.1.p1  ORF type:complete len:162 (+),score=26.82 GHVU01171752.1:116-601(+)
MDEETRANPSATKPIISAAGLQSAVLDKVRTFLPQMRESHEQLLGRAHSDRVATHEPDVELSSSGSSSSEPEDMEMADSHPHVVIDISAGIFDISGPITEESDAKLRERGITAVDLQQPLEVIAAQHSEALRKQEDENLMDAIRAHCNSRESNEGQWASPP